MVFLWFSYGFPMVFLWFSYGFPMFPSVFCVSLPSPVIHLHLRQVSGRAHAEAGAWDALREQGASEAQLAGVFGWVNGG